MAIERNKYNHIRAENVPQLDPFGRLKRPVKLEGKELLGGEEGRSFQEQVDITEIVIEEEEVWSSFLGENIDVPYPPKKLVETLGRAKKKGITSLEPHYFPGIEFTSESDYPGWHIQLDVTYWDQHDSCITDSDKNKLCKSWTLIDSTPKPDFDPYGPTMEYPNDSLNAIIDDSRFLHSWNKINKKILPQIAIALEIKKEMVRLPRAIESNICTNLFYPEWGNTTSDEWQADSLKYGGARLLGGDSNTDGFALFSQHVVHETLVPAHAGFRPMIVFPQEK